MKVEITSTPIILYFGYLTHLFNLNVNLLKFLTSATMHSNILNLKLKIHILIC